MFVSSPLLRQRFVWHLFLNAPACAWPVLVWDMPVGVLGQFRDCFFPGSGCLCMPDVTAPGIWESCHTLSTRLFIQ